MRRADGSLSAVVYPRLTHVLVNAAEVGNLQRRELEKFSAFGIPNQTLKLVHSPAVIPYDEVLGALPEDLHKESFIEVGVEENGEEAAWELHMDDDLRDADALYRALEHRVLPLYYDDPAGFRAVRKQAIASAPFLSARRMVQAYDRRYYQAT